MQRATMSDWRDGGIAVGTDGGVWVTDGTPAGTRLLKSTSEVSNILLTEDGAFFVVGGPPCVFPSTATPPPPQAPLWWTDMQGHAQQLLGDRRGA